MEQKQIDRREIAREQILLSWRRQLQEAREQLQFWTERIGELDAMLGDSDRIRESVEAAIGSPEYIGRAMMLRGMALAKLTPEERVVLGLSDACEEDLLPDANTF